MSCTVYGMPPWVEGKTWGLAKELPSFNERAQFPRTSERASVSWTPVGCVSSVKLD